MADKKSLLDAVKDRHSYYALGKESTISDDRIKELVEFTIKHAPGAFNVQSARAVVLLGQQHEKFWSKADTAIQGMVPKEVYEGYLKPRVDGFKAAYGCVLFFEDEADLVVLAQKNPMAAGLIPEWSDHSNGMFILWSAFEAEGLGCNLQHYNMLPAVVEFVQKEWEVPATWKLKSQLVSFEFSLRRISAVIQVEENVRIAQLEVKGVHNLCQEGDNPHAQFQERLLAEDAARASKELPGGRRGLLIHRDPCDYRSRDSEAGRRRQGTKRGPNSHSAHAGVTKAEFKCILSPPGTGKTTTIAALTEIYARCPDVGVLVCASSNGNTGRIYDVVCACMALSKKELDRNTHKPQRVYRVHPEEEYLLKNHGVIGNASKERLDKVRAARFMEAACRVSADAAWCERQNKTNWRKAMDDATTGVTHAVVEAVMTNRVNAFTAPGTRSAALGYMAILKAGLLNLRSIPFHKWTKNEKDAFIDAWRTLAQALIGRKRIVVCTAGLAVSSLMTEAFRECKHMVIILDEASLCTDPVLWNVVVNLFKPDRLESEFAGGTPVRAVVLVGDHHQGKPVIKSEVEPFNTFGQQLTISTFLRTVMTGFPIEGKYEQFRTPEVLCALPNRRCYGGKVRTSAAKKTLARQLPAVVWEFIVRYFEIGLAPFVHISDAEAREYAIDQYLRLQMLNVPGGKCQVGPHARSRFNMANVNVAMKFFSKLVTSLVKKGHLKISQIKILTFYNTQEPNELAHVVHTSDSFQGQEADVIILDTTVCSYTGHGTLGHVGDELKFNVAATRAKECLFVIGNLKILASEVVAEQEEVEFVMDLLQTLREQGSYKDFTSTAKPEKIVCAKFDYQVDEEDEEDEEDEKDEKEGDTEGDRRGRCW